jgi:hypothetical protein
MYKKEIQLYDYIYLSITYYKVMIKKIFITLLNV